jgi:3D (Asp-Asp-Asp) domain-containing protein
MTMAVSRRYISGCIVLLLLLAAACGKDRTLQVTATAYNHLAHQTEGDPRTTAWGDRLKPGMKAIAVSRDLIGMGLTHGTKVRIEGLRGKYVVRDKMHSRWTKRIDIYMGDDVEAAKKWGKREVEIRW